MIDVRAFDHLIVFENVENEFTASCMHDVYASGEKVSDLVLGFIDSAFSHGHFNKVDVKPVSTFKETISNYLKKPTLVWLRKSTYIEHISFIENTFGKTEIHYFIADRYE